MDPIALKLKHSDLLYDYVKFHLTLYIATPTALAIIANILDIATNRYVQMGMLGLVVINCIAGACAAWSVASHINVKWDSEQKWLEFGETAHSPLRRCVHHYLYWFGLGSALLGIFLAWYQVAR